MDRTVPAGAPLFLNFIAQTGVGSTGHAAYDVIYGHHQGQLQADHQHVAWRTDRWAGFLYETLQTVSIRLKPVHQELGLRVTQVFDPDLQDQPYQVRKETCPGLGFVSGSCRHQGRLQGSLRGEPSYYRRPANHAPKMVFFSVKPVLDSCATKITLYSVELLQL
ncbi:hypothetical protein M8994_16250 [Brucella sp. 21LCYQ03]|nr:hypothetical protein [Brucella sp. 21LCYQ03]